VDFLRSGMWVDDFYAFLLFFGEVLGRGFRKGLGGFVWMGFWVFGSLCSFWGWKWEIGRLCLCVCVCLPI